MSKKTFMATIIITAILLSTLIVPFAQLPRANADESSASDKAIAFVKQVVMIDVDKYNLTNMLGPFSGDPVRSKTYGGFTLKSETGNIDVDYKIGNNSVITYFTVYMRDVSPKFVQPLPTDLHENIADFLTRYQTFSGDQSLQEMRNMVENENLSKNGATFSDNLELDVQIIDSYTVALSWHVLFGGASYGSLNLEFYNGTFHSLGDDRSFVKIGGGTVNVSKDQAVQIALDNGQVNSYGTIVKDQIRIALITQSREMGSWVWYPCWVVSIPVYGGEGGPIVEIWADTAQINRVYLGTNFGGEPYNATSPSPSIAPTSSLTQSPQINPTIDSSPIPPTQSPSTTPTLTIAKSTAPSPSPTQQPTLPPLIDYTPTPLPTFAPPSSTIQPSPSPTPTPTPAVESVLVLITVLAVVVVVTGVLVYLRRTKKQKWGD